jgi:hypothetical protein
MKKRVFISFDFENDKILKDFIVGQSRLPDSPFEVIDHSLKEAAPERDWEKKAQTAIARSEIVIVMVGPKTHRAQGVLKEVEMARDLNKRIVQIIGYKEATTLRCRTLAACTLGTGKTLRSCSPARYGFEP